MTQKDAETRPGPFQVPYCNYWSTLSPLNNSACWSPLNVHISQCHRKWKFTFRLILRCESQRTAGTKHFFQCYINNISSIPTLQNNLTSWEKMGNNTNPCPNTSSFTPQVTKIAALCLQEVCLFFEWIKFNSFILAFSTTTTVWDTLIFFQREDIAVGITVSLIEQPAIYLSANYLDRRQQAQYQLCNSIKFRGILGWFHK